MSSVKVIPEIRDALMMPVEGEGGFQSLLRKLQSQLNQSNLTLELDATDVERIPRYKSYEPGGYEERLGTLVTHLRNLGHLPT
jgi:hypothetical protein